jgi:hypothetical protein
MKQYTTPEQTAKVIECCDKLLNEYMANEQTHRE